MVNVEHYRLWLMLGCIEGTIGIESYILLKLVTGTSTDQQILYNQSTCRRPDKSKVKEAEKTLSVISHSYMYLVGKIQLTYIHVHMILSSLLRGAFRWLIASSVHFQPKLVFFTIIEILLSLQLCVFPNRPSRLPCGR